jgi:hypothetical protein
MPENETLDPFKPAQPHIPGVSTPDEKAKEAEQAEHAQQATRTVVPPSGAPEGSPQNLKLVWMGLGAAGALGIILLLFGHTHRAGTAKNSAVAAPAESPATADASPASAGVPARDVNLPTGPGKVATVTQLAKAWSASEFYFRDPLTLKQAPAMVVRLPGGELWGFSLHEPFGTCELEYVTDLGKLKRDYDFTGTHPMVGDPCNKSVFDLMRYGNAPAGLVRGEVVKGSAFRPPLAIEVRKQGDDIVAVRTEQ